MYEMAIELVSYDYMYIPPTIIIWGKHFVYTLEGGAAIIVLKKMSAQGVQNSNVDFNGHQEPGLYVQTIDIYMTAYIDILALHYVCTLTGIRYQW